MSQDDSFPSYTVRVKLSTKNDSFVTVLVYSNGADPLDVKFVASEGEFAWSAAIKARNVRDLKASGNHASDKLWEAALKARFLLEHIPSSLKQELEGLECAATPTKDNKRLSLILRRSIGELTQRLGTIDLEQYDPEEVDPWAGCVTGARIATDTAQRLQELQDRLDKQQEENRRLQEQLQDLIKAKQEHEDALLHKFAELLNAKKLKIRDQQRLLATAKADPDKVEQVEKATARSRKAEPSRAAKRKAKEPALSEDEESSDGFESVDDKDMPDARDASTPEPMEDQDTTDDDEAVPTPPPEPEPKKGKRKGLGARNKPAASANTDGASSQRPSKTMQQENVSQKARETQKAQARDEDGDDGDDNVPPPRRELPFGRRKAAQVAEAKLSQDAGTRAQSQSSRKPSAAVSSPVESSATAMAGDDGDTTEDDDEL